MIIVRQFIKGQYMTVKSGKTGRLAAVIRMIVFVSAIIAICCTSTTAAGHKKKFPTPEMAVKALVQAVHDNDTGEILAILGKSGRDLVISGDPAADAVERDHFLKAYAQNNRLEEINKRKYVLHIGENDWPMPIPIVKTGQLWKFDTKAGRDEILARRIGRNELSAIQVCLAYVDAQREYAVSHKNAGSLEYARQFTPDPGKENGLCRKNGDETDGGMGPFISAACPSENSPAGKEPVPYHGYFYKILTGQGPHAPGGAYNYVINGKMIGGFALVAYPARYRSTGVMTFLVNHDGVVYEKDLGTQTSAIAGKMVLFDPDATWKKVE